MSYSKRIRSKVALAVVIAAASALTFAQGRRSVISGNRSHYYD